MAISNLKWAPINGLPKTTGSAPMYFDAEGPNPITNDIPTFVTTKHYKWLLKYQQLFHFFLVHGHHNAIRSNVDNSLAEWAYYQRSKLGPVDNYDLKWKHLLNWIGVCCSPPPSPNQVFKNHMLSYNALSGTWDAITQKKANNKALCGWWRYWRQQGKPFLPGESRKIKDQDWQKLF
jgi:hypothetical protein